MDQDTLKLIVRDGVKEVVQDELQHVMNLEREIYLQEHGGRKNGTYPRVLETP